MLENAVKRDQPADSPYKDMQNLKLPLLLTTNHYTNPNNFHLCFPIKTKKKLQTLTTTLTTKIDHSKQFFCSLDE